MAKKKIYYIYDALCGWCYGFSPVITAFHEKNSNLFEFEVLSGGMVRGARVGPISVIAPYIKEAYKQVEQTAGVTFGTPFLAHLDNPNGPVFDSIPAAKAMVILKHMKPENQVPFSAHLQKEVYLNGIDPSNHEAMVKALQVFGIDRDYALHALNTDEAGHKAAQEFALIENWGITGFPAVVIDRGDQLFLAAKGFTPLDQFEKTVNAILESKP